MFHNNKIRPRITHKANIHQVYGSFIETRGRLRDSAALADDLKNCGRNELISSALKNLSRTTPSARNVIFGNGKPETIEELGTGKNCYFFKPVSVENEINWAIQCLKPYKNLIAAYIQVRDEVEALILKGEFEVADRLLDLSINDFGHSVWHHLNTANSHRVSGILFMLYLHRLQLKNARENGRHFFSRFNRWENLSLIADSKKVVV